MSAGTAGDTDSTGAAHSPNAFSRSTFTSESCTNVTHLPWTAPKQGTATQEPRISQMEMLRTAKGIKASWGRHGTEKLLPIEQVGTGQQPTLLPATTPMGAPSGDMDSTGATHAPMAQEQASFRNQAHVKIRTTSPSRGMQGRNFASSEDSEERHRSGCASGCCVM